MPERTPTAKPLRHRWRPRPRWCWAGALLACGAAGAQPSLPWSPTTTGRHALQQLVDGAGLDLTTTHWPLPAAAVTRALDGLPARLPAALETARERVRDELRAHDRGAVGLTVRNHRDAAPGYGEDSTPGSSATWRSDSLQGTAAVARLGVRLEASPDADASGASFRFDDSAVATEWLGLQFQAWSHRNWWSPGWQNSLALSSNAPAFNAVGLQRASAGRSESPWLSWLGPWNFELFAAATDDDALAVRPYLLGTRLTLRPFSHVEIGLTKTAQWGGNGRPHSLRSLFDTFTGTGANSNPDTPDQQTQDPANTLAGFDVRLQCPLGWRCDVYGQLIGEDEAGRMPSRHLGMYGFSVWSADGRHRGFAEYAETGCNAPLAQPISVGCAYRNHAYPQGYTHGARWIGSSLGPDSRVITLGWIDAGADSLVKLHWGRIGSRIGTMSLLSPDAEHSGRLIGVSARRRFAFGPDTGITPELDWTRVHAASGVQQDFRVGVSMSTTLEGLGRGSTFSMQQVSPGTRLLWGLGLVAGAAALDRTVDDEAQRHDGASSQAVRRAGNAVPFIAAGLATVTWASQHGTKEGDVARDAFTAALAAAAGTQVLKYAVDRSRPQDGRGASDFGRENRQNSSFPSTHAAVAWAAVTPFAQHYDAPWLYGAAALTNAARVIGRDHWLSDTVAGALLGWGLGDWFHGRGAKGDDAARRPQVYIGDRSVAVQFVY